MSCERCGALAVAETVDAFRGQLVRQFGEPWYRSREGLVESLAALLVAVVPDRRERLARVTRWSREAFPQLEAWLGDLEQRRAA